MIKIGIFVPCYNVEKSIPNVLKSFDQSILDQVDEIVVVDNASEDKTVLEIDRLATSNPILSQKLVLIKNSKNYGLGGSQKIAYQYFIDHNFTHFFIVHGDNQGSGREIADGFLQVFRQNPQLDVIVASRFMKGSCVDGYDFKRVVGNYFFNILTYILTGSFITDSGAAIIFYKTAILNHFPFQDLINSFQFNPELNILLYENKALQIKEIPLRWTDSKDKSNIRPYKYCIDLLRILCRYFWNKNIIRRDGWQRFHACSQKIDPIFEIKKYKNII